MKQLPLVDPEEGQQERVNRWASNISKLLTPPLVNTTLAGAVAGRANPDVRETLGWLALYVLLTTILPMDMVALCVHRGHVPNMDVKKRQERMPALLIGIAVLLVAWGLFRALGAPVLFQLLLAASLIQNLIMTAITAFWQISFHGAAIAALAVVLAVLYGPVSYPAFLLVPLVWWSQVRLARHTWAQVAAGGLTGGSMYWLAPDQWSSGGSF